MSYLVEVGLKLTTELTSLLLHKKLPFKHGIFFEIKKYAKNLKISYKTGLFFLKKSNKSYA